LFASIGPAFAAIGDRNSRRPGGRPPIGGIARAGFAEWIIGSSRRECLAYVIVLGEANLRPHSKIILLQLRQNTSALRKDTPIFVRFNRSKSFVHTRSSAAFIIITAGFDFSVVGQFK
jgi:hypothetical protein